MNNKYNYTSKVLAKRRLVAYCFAVWPEKYLLLASAPPPTPVINREPAIDYSSCREV